MSLSSSWVFLAFSTSFASRRCRTRPAFSNFDIATKHRFFWRYWFQYFEVSHRSPLDGCSINGVNSEEIIWRMLLSPIFFWAVALSIYLFWLALAVPLAFADYQLHRLLQFISFFFKKNCIVIFCFVCVRRSLALVTSSNSGDFFYFIQDFRLIIIWPSQISASSRSSA